MGSHEEEPVHAGTETSSPDASSPEERVARSRTVADTAFSIAVVRSEEGRRAEAERLFDDPYAAMFAARGAHAAESTQRFLDLPFFREGVRLRTRFIDDAVREGLAAGVDQIVLLGAGFDARGLRMPEIPAHNARLYEVDTAEQLARKRDVLASEGVTLPSHVAYVPCDFDDPRYEDALAADLEASGFRRHAGAIFVWEGVIGYIGADEIDRALAFMAKEGGPRTRVVFTFAEGVFDPDTAETLTRRAGFSSCQAVAGDELWRRYLPGDPHPTAFVVKIGTAIV
jgi:methyltransferase (TIGR00027 family)